MRKIVQVVVSIILTVVIGFIIYRQVPDWGQSWQIMIEGRPMYFLAGFVFVLLHMVFRARRWGVLLTPVKSGISPWNLFSLTLIKYVVNVIPPRTGEVAASVVLARKENISATTVIAASVLERILDFITVLVLFGLYLVFLGHRYAPGSERGKEIMLSVRSYSIFGFIALCVGFAVLALMLRGKSWMNRMPGKIGKFVVRFLEGFRALQSRAAMVQVVALSFGIWLAITMQIWCLVLAYLNHFPFGGTFLLVAMTVVGVSIPTPGGVGGFQFFMNITLVNFFAQYLSRQDPLSQAAGISNGVYIVSMVPVILIGLILLNKEGLSLGRMSRLSAQAEDPAAAAKGA